MNRRELLAGAAVLAGVSQANAFGIGREGARGGFGRAGAVLGAAGYDAAAQSIFAAFTTPPSSARKAQINTLVLTLKAAGAWSALDCLYVLAAADSQAARINWKNPGTATLSIQGSPTFTTDRGFTGDGVSGFLQGPTWATISQYAINSNSLFDWVLNDIVSGTAEIGVDLASQPTLVNAQSTAGNAMVRSSNGTSVTVVVPNGIGFTGAFRTSPTDFVFQRNASQSTQTQGTTGIPTGSGNLVLLKTGTASFSTRQMAMGGAGGGLSGAAAAAAYPGFLTYMQAVGAA
jgi:hypothetical protein